MRTGGLLSLGLGFLNRIPILWTVVVVIALIGAIYYLIVGRTKAFAPVRALSPDDELQPATDTGGTAPA
jgi:hypothetical protein